MRNAQNITVGAQCKPMWLVWRLGLMNATSAIVPSERVVRTIIGYRNILVVHPIIGSRAALVVHSIVGHSAIHRTIHRASKIYC